MCSSEYIITNEMNMFNNFPNTIINKKKHMNNAFYLKNGQSTASEIPNYMILFYQNDTD